MKTKFWISMMCYIIWNIMSCDMSFESLLFKILLVLLSRILNRFISKFGT